MSEQFAELIDTDWLVPALEGRGASMSVQLPSDSVQITPSVFPLVKILEAYDPAFDPQGGAIGG